MSVARKHAQEAGNESQERCALARRVQVKRARKGSGRPFNCVEARSGRGMQPAATRRGERATDRLALFRASEAPATSRVHQPAFARQALQDAADLARIGRVERAGEEFRLEVRARNRHATQPQTQLRCEARIALESEARDAPGQRQGFGGNDSSKPRGPRRVAFLSSSVSMSSTSGPGRPCERACKMRLRRTRGSSGAKSASTTCSTAVKDKGSSCRVSIAPASTRPQEMLLAEPFRGLCGDAVDSTTKKLTLPRPGRRPTARSVDPRPPRCCRCRRRNPRRHSDQRSRGRPGRPARRATWTRSAVSSGDRQRPSCSASRGPGGRPAGSANQARSSWNNASAGRPPGALETVGVEERAGGPHLLAGAARARRSAASARTRARRRGAGTGRAPIARPVSNDPTCARAAGRVPPGAVGARALQGQVLRMAPTLRRAPAARRGASGGCRCRRPRAGVGVEQVGAQLIEQRGERGDACGRRCRELACERVRQLVACSHARILGLQERVDSSGEPIEERAESEGLGSGRARSSGGFFRRPPQCAASPVRGLGDGAGEPEVEQIGLARCIEPDVVGLQVAMQPARGVQRGEGAGDTRDDSQRVAFREWAPAESLAELGAREQRQYRIATLCVVARAQHGQQPRRMQRSTEFELAHIRPHVAPWSGRDERA